MTWQGWQDYRPPSLSETETTREKRSKYRNVKTTVDGQTFDSAKEARRWTELKALEQVGHIRNLERQVTFRIDFNGHEVCAYVADFVYIEFGADGVGVMTVEDVKSVATRQKRDYRIKAKLMKARYGIDIRET